MGKIVHFPIQKSIHWNGRDLNDEEIRYMRELLLSVSRRIRIKRIHFSGVDFRGNDMKVIIDKLSEKKIITDEEMSKVYEKLN